jgi:hypothetical protein
MCEVFAFFLKKEHQDVNLSHFLSQRQKFVDGNLKSCCILRVCLYTLIPFILTHSELQFVVQVDGTLYCVTL